MRFSGKYPYFLHNSATFMGYPVLIKKAGDRRRIQTVEHKEAEMKKVFVGLTMAVLFMVLTVCHAGAQGPQGPGRGHPGVGMEVDHPLWLDLPRLNIDRNRMDAIHEIEIRTAKESIRKRAELQVALIELRELLAKDPVEVNGVEAKLKQIAALRTDTQLARIKAIEEIKGKLTSEERKKFREFLQAVHMRPAFPRESMAGPGPCEQPPPVKAPNEKKAFLSKENVR